MSTRAALLAEIIASNKALLARYLAGFNNVTHVRQTPDLPNHLAWQLGHLALTMHRVAAMLDAQPLPAADFVPTPTHAGSRDKGVYDPDSVSFGSTPEERHDRFPTLDRCTEIFNNAADRLTGALAKASDEKLDESVSWGQQQMPLRLLVARMVFHNGFHTGQIADMRRALGFKGVFS
jgi:hypothetical protein